MNYSTLKEVYDVDTFEREKKKKKKNKNEDNHEESENIQQIPIKSSEPIKSFINNNILSSKTLNNVQPYYDEELEQYLNINDSKTLKPIISEQIPKSNNDSEILNLPSPTSLKSSNISEIKQDIQTSKSIHDIKKEQFYKNLINIGLFIFIGVLIIFLCDQITEIAINIGMKKTMGLLDTYLSEIRAKKDL